MPPKRKKSKPDPFAFLNLHPFVQPTVVDKINGCIIGSALGDTIGLYTEFLTKANSATIYGDRSFQLLEPATKLHPDAHRTRFAPCAWTDDTDQALLIILSFLHNCTNAPPKRFEHTRPAEFAAQNLYKDFAGRVKIWIEQGLLALNRHACDIGALVGSVVGDSRYLEDPVALAVQRWIGSGYTAAPNGSLMRTHPIGVIGVGKTEEETWDLSIDVGATTHADPRCTVSCCIEVGLVRGLVRGDILDEEGVDACIERSYEYVRRDPAFMNPGDEDLTEDALEQRLNRGEFERHVYAESLEDLELDAHGVIGYVYKCIGSAILLLRLAMRRQAVDGGPLAAKKLFEELTVDLIMEGGDADTNATAACALLGAFVGYANLPLHWTMGLAHKEWLLAKTHRLAVASGVISDVLQPEGDEVAEGPHGKLSKRELSQRWQLMHA